MLDVLERAATLNRPRLLVRAAKAAAEDYQRKPHLARVLPGQKHRRHRETVLRLLEREHDLEANRRNQSAGYLVSDHLDVLIALIAEVRLLSEAQSQTETDLVSV